MKLAVLGAGNVGATLGRRWHAAGHTVTFGVRRPDDSKYDALRTFGCDVVTLTDAVAVADIVVLATPWPVTRDLVERLAEALTDKVLVDCTNPLLPNLAGLEFGHDTSGAEQIAAWAPGARVVKAFNTTGFGNMDEPVIGGRATMMYVAGDDDAARRSVVELSDALGFDTVDAGGLATARQLEPLALLWIRSAYQFGLGRDFGFALLRRPSDNPTTREDG